MTNITMTRVLQRILLQVLVFFSQLSNVRNQFSNNELRVSVPDKYCNNDNSVAELKNIMNETGTDKGFHHGYYRTYGRLFAPLKYDRVRLLEIGVKEGNSVGVWTRYFPNYEHIYGIGYNNFQTERKSVDSSKNITLYMGDQSDVDFLNWVCRDAQAPFDIIIDDGSHLPIHQKISIRHLMSCLKPGGYYIVEDIETSYWNNPRAKLYGYKFRGYGLYKNSTFIENAKLVVDVINRQYHQKFHFNFLGIDQEVASVAFEQNLVIFRKVDSWDYGFHDRGYNCRRIDCSDQ